MAQQPASDDGLDGFFASYQKAQPQPGTDGLDDFFSSYQRANAPVTAGRVAREAGQLAGQGAMGAVRMGGLALSTVARAADAAAAVVNQRPDLEQKVMAGMDRILEPMHRMYDFRPGEEPSFAGQLAGGILSTPISMLDWPEGGIERYEEAKAAGASEEEARAAGMTRAGIGAAQQFVPLHAGGAAAARVAGPLVSKAVGAVTGAGIGVASGAAGRALENVVAPEDIPSLQQRVIPTGKEAALEAVPGGIFGVAGAVGHRPAAEPHVEPEARVEPAQAPPEEVTAAPAPTQEAPPSGGEPRAPEEELKAQPVKSDRQQELERLRELAADPDVQVHLDKEIAKEQAASKKAFDAEQKALSAQDQAAELRRLAGQTNDPELSKQLSDRAEKLSPTPKPETKPTEGETKAPTSETKPVESEPAGAAGLEPTPTPVAPSEAQPAKPETAPVAAPAEQIFTGKTMLGGDQYGATIGRLSEGTQRRLLVDPAGGHFWGESKEAIDREGNTQRVGEHAGFEPALFPDGRSARAAAEATPQSKREPTAQKAAPAPEQKPMTQGRSPFFRAIHDELGGVHTSEREDAGFDKAAPVMLGGRGPDGKARGPLFNGNGATMDRLVEWMQGKGYLTDAEVAHADENITGGSHQLAYDMLQREMAQPGSVLPIRDQGARWQGISDVQRQREILDAAEKAGVETSGRTLESIERDLWAAEDHAHAERFGHPPEHLMTALAARLDPDAVERLSIQHENDEPAFHKAIGELINAHPEHVDTSGLGRGAESGPGRAVPEPAVRVEHPQAAAVQGEAHAVRGEQGAGHAGPGERAEAGPAVPEPGAERGGAAAAEAREPVARDLSGWDVPTLRRVSDRLGTKIAQIDKTRAEIEQKLAEPNLSKQRQGDLQRRLDDTRAELEGRRADQAAMHEELARRPLTLAMKAASDYVAKAAKGIATPEDARAALDDHVANIKAWLTRNGVPWLHEGTQYRADPTLGDRAHVGLENGRWTVAVGHDALAMHPNDVERLMLHEHTHILDWMGGLYSQDPAMRMGQGGEPIGEAAKELHSLYREHPIFQRLLEYPFGPENADLHSDPQVMQAELFAQAVVARSTELREVIQREAPEAEKFLAAALKHATDEGVTPTTGPKGAEDFRRLSESFAAARSGAVAAEPTASAAGPASLGRTLFGKPTLGYQHYQGVAKPKEEPAPMRLKDSLEKTLAPASRGGFAQETAGIVRANYGEQARQQAVAEERLKQAAKAFDARPADQNLDFIDRMERGQAQPTAKLDGVAKALRGVLDQKLGEVRALGTGALNHFIENYFPHMWLEKDEALRDIYAARRPMQGSKAFLKERTIPFTKDGLRWRAYDSDGAFQGSFDTEAQAKAAMPAGGRVGRPLTPVSHNPVEMVLLKAREVDRYVYGQRIFGEMGSAGFLQKVPHGTSGPAGWSPINDSIAHAGDGRYWAPEEAARLINNHLSPGLRGNTAFEMWRYAGNTLNGLQLGMSAYHLGFTTLDTMVSKAALGMKQASRGDVGKGAWNIAQSLNPAQPIFNYLKGDRLLRAYLGKLQDPGLAPVLAALQDAGGRVKQDAFYSNEAIKKFNQAGALGKVRQAIPALTELINKPIFEHLVPRQKLGVFTDMAKDWLEANPNASIEERRVGLGKLWDSVDNRMGQLVYDNLFWNRTLKDALFASVRSVGWNLGTFRELGGGLLDLKDIAKNKQLSDRSAYLFALPFVAGVGGALTQMIYGMANGLSAEDAAPKDAKDLYFPRTFKQRPDGSEDRVSLPSYMKDVVAYAHDPVQTISNKAHPLISLLGQELTNRDFFGAAIHDPGDPEYKQWLDRAAYAAREMLPFSWQNYQQQAKAAGKEPSAVDWLTSPQQIGLAPAPAYVTRSPEQNVSAELSTEHEPLLRRYVQELRTGTDRAEVIQSAQRSGFSRREIQMMLRQAERTGGPRRLRAFGGEAQP